MNTDEEREKVIGEEINDMIEQIGQITPFMVENEYRRNGRLP